MQPWRASSVAVIAMAAISVISSCASDSQALTWARVSEEQPFSAVLADVQPGQARVVSGMLLCLTSAHSESAPVVLKAVRPGVEIGELDITEFRVRRRPAASAAPRMIPAEAEGVLAAAAEGPDAEVREACPDWPQEPARETLELVLELIPHSDRPSAIDSLVVEYTADGRPRDVAVPVLIWLCPGQAVPRGVGCA